MKPVYLLSEDAQHMQMITEDGSLYTFDRIRDEDLEAIKGLMEGAGDE